MSRKAELASIISITNGQIETFKLRAMYRHAEIVSGGYKFKSIKKGTVSGGCVELTDEEKLKDSLQIMQRHIEFIEKSVEGLAEFVEEYEGLS